MLRYYNQANGTFNRLDPFSGNTTDPQSFHKYTYTHADPVNQTDPTGLNPRIIAWIARIGVAIATRIILGWAAEYTLRKAYEKEVGKGPLVQTRGEQIGRVGDRDLPPGGWQENFKLKPDILDKRPNQKMYYEIKPSNPYGWYRGRKDLEAYDEAIADRWPGGGYTRGTWSPNDLIYWLKTPTFLNGVDVELPLIIISWNAGPAEQGLILYDEITLTAQAIGLTLTAEALARIALKLRGGPGGGGPGGGGPGGGGQQVVRALENALRDNAGARFTQIATILTALGLTGFGGDGGGGNIIRAGGFGGFGFGGF